MGGREGGGEGSVGKRGLWGRKGKTDDGLGQNGGWRECTTTEFRQSDDKAYLDAYAELRTKRKIFPTDNYFLVLRTTRHFLTLFL